VKSFNIKIATTVENMSWSDIGVRAYPRGYRGIYTPKLDLTRDAEYVTNLVNVSM